MATIDVVFEDAWLTDVTTPAVSVHASFPERGSNPDLEGAVRFYAGGRRRVITSASRSNTFGLTLQLLSDVDLVLLESWAGRVLLLRDGEGRRVFGTFLSLDVEDFWDPDGTLHSASLTFVETTFIEGT